MSTAKCLLGGAVAQTVSCLLPTAAARVRTRVKSCGICGGQSGSEAGFLGVHWFPLPNIPPTAPPPSHHPPSSFEANTIAHLGALDTVDSVLPHPKEMKEISTAVAWYRLPTVDILFLLDSRSVPGLSHLFVTATAHSS
jgi:hypothetical protein